MTRSDADLAVIIGHELAHANLGHIRKQQQNALIGQVGGAVIDGGLMLGGIYTGWTFSKHFKKAGAMAYSVDFEREADYVGAYYAARAGYDISGAENVWRAMALESPASIRLATTHPTTPARYLLHAQDHRRDRRQRAPPSAADAGAERRRGARRAGGRGF